MKNHHQLGCYCLKKRQTLQLADSTASPGCLFLYQTCLPHTCTCTCTCRFIPCTSTCTCTVCSLNNCTLYSFIFLSDSSPPKPEAPIDEKQRLVSASYVNYGPTTNNGVSEYQVKEVVHKPSEGTGEMLRSTLEDGFKTMFPNMQPRTTIRQGLQAGQTGSAHVTSQLYNPSVKLESKDTPTTEWPDLQTDKPSGPSSESQTAA